MRLYGVTCIIGTGEGEVKGKTVEDVINNLCLSKGTEFESSIYKPGTRMVSEQYIVLVNGERIDTKRGLGRKVKKGDIVSILPDLGPCC